jgi:protein TonB
MAEEPPRIVDAVFGRRDRGEHRRWAWAALAAAVVYAVVFLVLPLVAAPSLQEWASTLAARIHAAIEPRQEIAIETPPPPPPVETPPPPPPPPRATRRSRPAPPPTPATSAPIVARAPAAEPAAPAETFVTGTAPSFAGGATTSSGTSTQPVPGRTADPKGTPGGTGQDLAHPVALDAEDWACPWPREAEAADIDEQVVVLRAAVRADGRASDVRIVSDPGHGFGAAARTCALSTHFQPARDRSGNATFAWSPAIRVRFIR